MHNDFYCTEFFSYRSQWWPVYAIHHSDVIISAMASPGAIICSTICSGTDQRKHQSSTSQAFVRGIHWWPVDSPHKGPVMWKMLPSDDAMINMAVNRQQAIVKPITNQLTDVYTFKIYLNTTWYWIPHAVTNKPGKNCTLKIELAKNSP